MQSRQSLRRGEHAPRVSVKLLRQYLWLTDFLDVLCTMHLGINPGYSVLRINYISHRIEYTVPRIKYTGDKIYCDTGCCMLRHNIRVNMRVAGCPRYTAFS